MTEAMGMHEDPTPAMHLQWQWLQQTAVPGGYKPDNSHGQPGGAKG
jgi:hypothetical protein